MVGGIFGGEESCLVSIAWGKVGWLTRSGGIKMLWYVGYLVLVADDISCFITLIKLSRTNSPTVLTGLRKGIIPNVY